MKEQKEQQISPNDSDYPKNLERIDNPPIIYVKGKIRPEDVRAVAIVGSRHPTPRGKALAGDYAWNLASSGITIVSGLAMGIDTEAHQKALFAAGRTIAVLGCGLNQIWRYNKNSVKRITENGAIVTEFEPDTPPYPGNFLARNRLISALSIAVLVVEAKRNPNGGSGTLSTATWAADQGIEVFAIPGSEITDYLIGEGAEEVKSPEKIIDYVNFIIDRLK